LTQTSHLDFRSQNYSCPDSYVVDAARAVVGATYDHVDLLVPDPILELHHELQFVAQGSEIGAFRLNVEVDVSSDPVFGGPRSEQANDRMPAEATLRQSYDFGTFYVGESHSVGQLEWLSYVWEYKHLIGNKKGRLAVTRPGCSGTCCTGRA